MEMHFDGGRGFKRLEVMVASIQPVLGEGTRALQKRARDGEMMSSGSLLKINHCGNTFANHLIYGVMQKKSYEHDDACLFHFAEILVKDLHKLLTEGFRYKGRHFRIATIGCKGDAALIAKLGRLNRCFGHIRKKANAKCPEPLAGCCWQCPAGQDNAKGKIPFEDFRPDAEWTMLGPGDDPWDISGPLLGITECVDPLFKASFYRMDNFHITMKGHGQHYAASALTYMRPIFGGSNWDLTFESMNIKFKEYKKEQKKWTHMSFFSPGQLGHGEDAFVCGHWQKGSDTAVIMSFIEWMLDPAHSSDEIKQMVQEDIMLQKIYDGARAIHYFQKELHEDGQVFIAADKARKLAKAGYTYLRCYGDLSVMAVEKELFQFAIIPKLHYFHHIVHDMWTQVKQGLEWAWNPLVDEVSMDEDYIGRVCRQSRRVDPRNVPLRTLERVLCSTAECWDPAVG